MIYKSGERMREFLGCFCFYCSLVFYILGAFLIKQLFHSRLLDIHILLDVLLCSIAEYFYELCRVLASP